MHEMKPKRRVLYDFFIRLQTVLYLMQTEEFYIISQSGWEFFLGTEFQDFAFDPTHKGLFKDIIKDNDLINLEPYQTHGYYNQQKSLNLLMFKKSPP